MYTRLLAVLGLASLFAGWVIGFISPGIRDFLWAIFALGAALIAVAVVLDYRSVGGAIASRRGRFGIGASVSVSLFAGIILLANGISANNFHRFDFTGLSQFTLTTQTKEALEDLEQSVEIVTFFTPQVPPQVSSYGLNLLKEYQNLTDQLTLRQVDPDLRPDEARQYGVNRLGAQYGMVVFRSDEGQRAVYGFQIAQEAEHAFTSAVLEVTGIKQRKVYFLTGHGENSIRGDYDSVRSGLRDNLFQVGELDLLRTPTIPDDAAVLVLAGPRERISTSELEILRAYLNDAGRLMILVNPNPGEEVRELLREWGIEVGEGTVIDPTSNVAPNPDVPLVPRTRNQYGLQETYFPGATALMPAQEVELEGFTVRPLALTSLDSWLERGGEAAADGSAQFDEGVDQRGPLAIAVDITEELPEGAGPEALADSTRLVVFGDSDFGTNQHFRNGNNSDLFLTTVNFLAAGEQIISVDRKVLPVRRLVLSPEEARFLHVSSIGLLPLVLLVTAAFLWWRRR